MRRGHDRGQGLPARLARRAAPPASQARLDDPEKAWKFRIGDLDDRRHFGEYQEAYEEAIRETSTKWAPWYVVPSDHNWVRNLAVAQILVDTLGRLHPELPAPDPGLEGLQVV